MTKKEIENQINILIERINNPQNSVFILQPLVQEVYRLVTNNQNFEIYEHLSANLNDGGQNQRRVEMVQLLEGIKEQLDLFLQENETSEPGIEPIGFNK